MASILSRPQCVNSLRSSDTICNLVNTGVDNDLVSARNQAITWINADYFQLDPQEQNFVKSQSKTIFCH